MAFHDTNTTLSQDIGTAICLDNLRRQHQVSTQPPPCATASQSSLVTGRSLPNPCNLGEHVSQTRSAAAILSSICASTAANQITRSIDAQRDHLNLRWETKHSFPMFLYLPC